jgi:type IV secretion system protein VirB11
MMPANVNTENAIIHHFQSFVDYTGSDGLSELMVNPDGSLYIEKEGYLIDCNKKIPSEKTYSFIRLLAGYRNTIIDKDNPSVPMRLPDAIGGGRVQAVIPPVTSGPMFSIRFPPKKKMSAADLIEKGTFSRVKYNDEIIRHEEVLELVEKTIAERKTILFAGATSSGKTTILNALYDRYLSDERIFVIEDVPEILLRNKDTVYMLTYSRYSTRDAVFDCMRLRPDRIIVGEIRDGNTAIELCKCFLTGHPGGTSSIHADSARGALFRLKSLMKEVVQTPDNDLINNSIDYVFYVRRVLIGNKYHRNLEEIYDVSDMRETVKYSERSIA